MSEIYSELKRKLDKMSSLSGAGFRQIRKQMGLTQVHLADLLKVDAKTISRIECGHWPVSRQMVLSLTLLGDVWKQKQSGRQLFDDELRRREQQAFLRALEAAEAERRRKSERQGQTRHVLPEPATEACERVKDPLFTHGPGKRKRKKKKRR